MIGHVINLLVHFVGEKGGDTAVDQVFERSGVPRTEFRFDVVYPEETFAAILKASVETLGVTPEQGERAFAEYFVRVSPTLFPDVFRSAPDARRLLASIPALHNSIPSAATRGAYREKLVVEENTPSRLVFRYDSPHRMCRFLMRGSELVLEHYNERGQIEELECARKGAPACRVAVRFFGSKRQAH
jgi:hypothetical protein